MAWWITLHLTCHSDLKSLCSIFYLVLPPNTFMYPRNLLFLPHNTAKIQHFLALETGRAQVFKQRCLLLYSWCQHLLVCKPPLKQKYMFLSLISIFPTIAICWCRLLFMTLPPAVDCKSPFSLSPPAVYNYPSCWFLSPLQQSVNADVTEHQKPEWKGTLWKEWEVQRSSGPPIPHARSGLHGLDPAPGL